MTRLACILALMFAVPQTPSKNFDVDSTFEKQRDFASFKTYAWAAGHDAFDRSVDKLIRNAIDSEMKALGFGPGVAGKADVTIRYHSGLSTEVDLKALGRMSKEEAAAKAPPTHKLGVLAVVMGLVAHDQRVGAAGMFGDHLGRRDPRARAPPPPDGRSGTARCSGALRS